MKKALAVLLIAVFAILPSFAKEGDVHVTKTSAAVFNLDVGGSVLIPVADEKNKTFGVFGAVAFTPASFSKINAGIKAELSVNGFTGEQAKKLGASGYIFARMYIRKSFEIYAGAGARFLIWDIVSLTDYSHGWGVALQGGARGRVLNWLGVGVQGTFLKGFDRVADQLEIQLYASVEL